MFYLLLYSFQSEFNLKFIGLKMAKIQGPFGLMGKRNIASWILTTFWIIFFGPSEVPKCLIQQFQNEFTCRTRLRNGCLKAKRKKQWSMAPFPFNPPFWNFEKKTSVSPSVRSTFDLQILREDYLSTRSTAGFSVSPSFHLSACPCVRQSISPSVRQSVSPAVRQSICLSVRQLLLPVVFQTQYVFVLISIKFLIDVRPSVHRPSVSASVRQSVSPSIRQSVQPTIFNGCDEKWMCESQKKKTVVDGAISI
jgi:hypothetical protein